MLLPSRSTLRPMVEPNPRPMGCLAQPSSRRYGLGAALGPALESWANVGADDIATAATTAIPHNKFTRTALRIGESSLLRLCLLRLCLLRLCLLKLACGDLKLDFVVQVE